MSDEYFKEIADRVKSGEYFQDARDWYQNKYLSPVIERAYFILLSLLVILLIIFAWATLQSFKPLKPLKPLLVTVADQTSQYTVFKVLGNRADREENPHPEVQKYLMEKFVEAYETYDFRRNFEKLKSNESMIGSLAHEDVLGEYKNYLSTSNPDSPLLRLRDKAILNVSIDKGSFNIQRIAAIGAEGKNAPVRYAAAVDFSLHETNISGTQTTKWRAQIGFSYKEIRFDRETKDFTPMEFKVTSYASQKIQ